MSGDIYRIDNHHTILVAADQHRFKYTIIEKHWIDKYPDPYIGHFPCVAACINDATEYIRETKWINKLFNKVRSRKFVH